MKALAEPPTASNEIQRTFHRASLETAEAHHLFLFSEHETKMQGNLLPERSAALFLECNDDWDWTKAGDPFKEWDNDVQYGELVRRAFNLNIPICYADTQISNSFELIDGAVTFAEGTAGLALGAMAIKTVLNNSKPDNKSTRRKFFESTGLAALGAYLVSPLVSGLFLDRPEKLCIDARLLSREIHPESMKFSVQFRDLVTAYKTQWYSKNSMLLKGYGEQSSPLVVTVLGTQHLGVENNFQRTQNENLASIAKYARFFPSLISAPKTFYCIRVSNPDGGSSILEIPELKNIWERSLLK